LGCFRLGHYYEPLFDDTQLQKPLSENRQLPGLNLNSPGQLSFLKALVTKSPRRPREDVEIDSMRIALQPSEPSRRNSIGADVRRPNSRAKIREIRRLFRRYTRSPFFSFLSSIEKLGQTEFFGGLLGCPG